MYAYFVDHWLVQVNHSFRILFRSDLWLGLLPSTFSTCRKRPVDDWSGFLPGICWLVRRVRREATFRSFDERLFHESLEFGCHPGLQSQVDMVHKGFDNAGR